MALIANRRSVMTLFSDPACIQSHRTRIVLSEKDITADVVQIDHNNKPEDLSELNPYNSVPTLVDRDLVLYDSRVIMEYFDERLECIKCRTTAACDGCCTAHYKTLGIGGNFH